MSVFSWGSGDFFALGHGVSMAETLLPKSVLMFPPKCSVVLYASSQEFRTVQLSPYSLLHTQKQDKLWSHITCRSLPSFKQCKYRAQSRTNAAKSENNSVTGGYHLQANWSRSHCRKKNRGGGRRRQPLDRYRFPGQHLYLVTHAPAFSCMCGPGKFVLVHV
jgi:hypothetical protein